MMQIATNNTRKFDRMFPRLDGTWNVDGTAEINSITVVV